MLDTSPLHRLRLPLSLMLALVGLTAPASAAPLPFEGTMSIVFGPFPIFAVVEGSGVAEVNTNPGGLLTALQIPAGVFAATGLEFPGTTVAISGVQVDAMNGAGAFDLTTNAGGGMMPISGGVFLCILAPCGQPGLVLTLPLTPVGAGGTAQVTGPVTLTLHGAPWTKGTTTISTTFAVTILQGFAHGPASLTASTAQPGGVLELVTPVRVATSIPGLDELTGYAVLQLTFVPEPSTASLLGVSLAAMAWGVRKRSAGRKAPATKA